LRGGIDRLLGCRHEASSGNDSGTLGSTMGANVPVSSPVMQKTGISGAGPGRRQRPLFLAGLCRRGRVARREGIFQRLVDLTAVRGAVPVGPDGDGVTGRESLGQRLVEFAFLGILGQGIVAG